MFLKLLKQYQPFRRGCWRPGWIFRRLWWVWLGENMLQYYFFWFLRYHIDVWQWDPVYSAFNHRHLWWFYVNVSARSRYHRLAHGLHTSLFKKLLIKVIVYIAVGSAAYGFKISSFAFLLSSYEIIITFTDYRGRVSFMLCHNRLHHANKTFSIILHGINIVIFHLLRAWILLNWYRVPFGLQIVDLSSFLLNTYHLYQIFIFII